MGAVVAFALSREWSAAPELELETVLARCSMRCEEANAAGRKFKEFKLGVWIGGSTDDVEALA